MSWWTRGGEPGPGYTSDKLDVVVSGRTISGTYVRARFDQSYDPPFKPEEFTGDVPDDLWHALSAAIDGEQIFARHLPAEDKADLADALKDTIEVVVDGQVTTKTMYDLAERDLPHTRAQVKTVAAYLLAHGRHRLLKQPSDKR